nr:hypothetical protein BHM03_00000279 [Ipomoea batatas]
MLVPPPLVEASPAPVHFQNAGGENADEESQEPQAGSIVQLRSNEFSCEETHGWEGTKWNSFQPCFLIATQNTKSVLGGNDSKLGSFGRLSSLEMKSFKNISVSISVNPIKPVRELNKAHSLSQQWIHHETHRLPQRLAVVDVVIAVQIQHERRVRLFSLDTYTNLGARGSMSNFLQKGTHFLANSDTSDNASNVNMAAPSSET